MLLLMLSAHLYLKTPKERVPLEVEVPQTLQEQFTGLSQVKELSPSKGMLFIFQKEEKVVFTMKETPVDLTLLFFDHNHKLIESKTYPAFYPHLIYSKPNCQYVLEAHPSITSNHSLPLIETELHFHKKKLDD